MANDFASEPDVLIAKVDAEAEDAKATAKEQGVTSYPTIKYFPKGSKTPQPYEGGRSEKDLIEFLNEHAGTHRTVGGGLDTKAGTIATLDAIVAKFVEGGSLATIAAEAQKAAQGIKDKSAKYYVKVFEKLDKNSEYAQKELTRLQGIMKKGGLAPEKVDDLTARSNVLQKFLGTKDAAKDEL